MGLLLSVLVVCIGVLEAISCARHVQHGYLPFWATTRLRPMLHERPRRKPNEESSDEDDELSRILHNGGGVNINRAESPSYGLTPILTEHRRNTPILRDNEEEDDDEPKYVANNIDEPSYTGSCRDGLTERFRPISPPELDGPVDESYVSQTGKFLALPPDGNSPLQRSSSEETLHDSETEDIRSPLDEAPCPVVEHVLAPEGVVFQIDTSSPPVVAGTELLEEDLQNDEESDDLVNDPVYNLVSAAAYILSNEPHPSRRSPVVGITSSTRPLNLDPTARLPTPQSHRESIPFDLAAAHAQASTSSRPETPGTPRKSRADISWPVFHPEPVIKRPIIAHSELSRDLSIEEDDDLIPEPSHSLEPDAFQPPGACVEDQCSKVVVRSLTDVPATPFVVIPGCRRIGSHKSLPEASSPPPPPCKTSYDMFGRITCTPHKGRFSRKRRGSLERPAVEGTLKDSVMSKSLPDFFFEEKALSDAASKMAADDAKMVVDEESVSLGKDITPKESSIKRRRSYREKKRSTWTPNKSRGVENVVAEPLSESEAEDVKPKKKSLFEIDNESLDEFVGSTEESVNKVESTDSVNKVGSSEESVNKVGTEAEAIVNSAQSPVEVLHLAEDRRESAVFATSRQQPKTRLKKPIKAESFEEAPPPTDVTSLRLECSANTAETTPSNSRSSVVSAPAETKPPPPPPAVDSPVTSDATKPPRDPAAKPYETNANDNEEEGEEEEEEDNASASQADTSNINQAQQSSQPAPFWVRRH